MMKLRVGQVYKYENHDSVEEDIRIITRIDGKMVYYNYYMVFESYPDKIEFGKSSMEYWRFQQEHIHYSEFLKGGF